MITEEGCPKCPEQQKYFINLLQSKIQLMGRKYKIGDKVELHNADELVVIKGVIDDNTYLIQDTTGDVKMIHRNKIKLSSHRKKIRKSKKVKKEKKQATSSPIFPLKEKKGEERLYLAFEFLSRADNDGFIPYIVNKSGTNYDIEINVKHGSYFYIDDMMNVPPYHAVKLQFLSSRILSAPTTLKLQLTEYFTDGTKDAKSVSTKLKPHHFQGEPSMDNNLQKRIIQRELTMKKPGSVKNLKNHAKNLERKQDESPERKVVKINDPEQTAHFKRRLDLHLNALVDDPSSYDASEALQLQLKKMRNYLDTAFQLKFRSVIIIHGKGKGRLRKEIESHCRKDSRIQGCQSGYGSGYDHGSTEVYFN